MMGKQSGQIQMVILDIDSMIPEDHLLRRIKKEVLTISVGDNESSKYWLSVLNELKNRGVKDVLVICADGLTGIKEAVSGVCEQKSVNTGLL